MPGRDDEDDGFEEGRPGCDEDDDGEDGIDDGLDGDEDGLDGDEEGLDGDEEGLDGDDGGIVVGDGICTEVLAQAPSSIAEHAIPSERTWRRVEFICGATSADTWVARLHGCPAVRALSLSDVR